MSEAPSISGLARTPTRRQPAVMWAIGAAWTVALVAEVSGRAQMLHHDALATSRQPAWQALGLFLLAWQLMIVAMMLPSSLPAIRHFDRVNAAQPNRRAAKAAFLGGYAAVWTFFAVAAFFVDLAMHDIVESWNWLAVRPWLFGGGVLVLAGAFQFSTLKDRCLKVCRSPAGHIAHHHGSSMGAAFRLGMDHGIYCVGCCWALMLVAFAVGVANLWWMATLTAVMVFEKTRPGGTRGVRPIGFALLGLGAMVLSGPMWTSLM